VRHAEPADAEPDRTIIGRADEPGLEGGSVEHMACGEKHLLARLWQQQVRADPHGDIVAAGVEGGRERPQGRRHALQ